MSSQDDPLRRPSADFRNNAQYSSGGLLGNSSNSGSTGVTPAGNTVGGFQSYVVLPHTSATSGPVVVVSINKRISEAEDSSILSLSNRSLSCVPNEVNFAATDKLSDTRFVDISRNCLIELGDGLCKLMSLIGLNCEKNTIRCISPHIANLVHLQFLNLSCNQLTEFPESLARVTRLKTLSMKSNRIASVSPHINRLVNLQKLDLSHNEITTLPDELCGLTSLRCLNVRQNALRTLPEDMGQLTLYELDVSSNRLRTLPLSLILMRTCLKQLAVHSNPLDSPPLHIALRGRTHVLNYLAKQEVTERVKMGLLMQQQQPVGGLVPTFNFGASHGLNSTVKTTSSSSRDSGYQTSEGSEERIVRNAWASKSFPSQPSNASRSTRSSSLCNGPSTPNVAIAQNGGDRNSGSNIPSSADARHVGDAPPQTSFNDRLSKLRSSDKSLSLDRTNIPNEHSMYSHSKQNNSRAINALGDTAIVPSEVSVTKRICIPASSSAVASNRKVTAINRASHDSVDSTSSTLTDRSAEHSPARNASNSTCVSPNGHTEPHRSRNAKDEINLADFEDFDDDEGDDDDAMFASIRRRSNALSFSDSENKPGTTVGQDLQNDQTPTCEEVPYDEERKCPIVFDCDTLTLHSPPLTANHQRNSKSSDCFELAENVPQLRLASPTQKTGFAFNSQTTDSCNISHSQHIRTVAANGTCRSSLTNCYANNITNNCCLTIDTSSSNSTNNNSNRAMPPKTAPKPTVVTGSCIVRKYQSPMRPPNKSGVPVLPPKFASKARSTSCDPKRLLTTANTANHDSHFVVTRIIDKDSVLTSTSETARLNGLNGSLSPTTNASNAATYHHLNSAEMHNYQYALASPPDYHASQLNGVNLSPSSSISPHASSIENVSSYLVASPPNSVSHSDPLSTKTHSVKTSSSTFTPQTAFIALEESAPGPGNEDEDEVAELSSRSDDPPSSASSDRSVAMSLSSRSKYTVSPDAGRITARRQALNFQDERKALKSLKQVLEGILGERLDSDLQEALSDGVHLCNFINALQIPNATVLNIKYPSHGPLVKTRLQNAIHFVDACIGAGLPQNKICSPYDIVEKRNFPIVCRTIEMLLQTAP